MGKTAKASVQGLKKIKQAIAKKGWRKTSPAFLDTACVSAATLKRFWRGIPIGLDSFEAICQAVNIESHQVITPHHKNDSTVRTKSNASANSQLKNSRLERSPNDDSIRDRQGLLQSLPDQLLPTTRILSITGLTGTGKTVFAQGLAKKLKDRGYTCVQLKCTQAAPLTLSSIAHVLARQRSARARSSFSDLRSGVDSLVENHLLPEKYLFVIDGFDHLLGNSPKTGWGSFKSEVWRSFFRSILQADRCDSRFILTAQEVPNELSGLSDRGSNYQQVCTLAGLTPSEQTALFAAASIDDSHGHLKTIGAAYEGHPLALQTIARSIAADFQGDVARYWQAYGHHFRKPSSSSAADSGLAVSPWPNLHGHSRLLQNYVQPEVMYAIARLKKQIPDAFELLCLGCRDCIDSLPCAAWMQIGQRLGISVERSHLLISVLRDRAFLIPTVPQNQLHFHPHPLVRSLMLTQIHSPLKQLGMIEENTLTAVNTAIPR